MGISFSIDGSFRLKRSEESSKALEKLYGQIDSDIDIEAENACVDGVDEVIVNVGGCTHCSGTQIGEMCMAFSELNEHVTKPFCLSTCVNNEYCSLWIGKPEEIAKAKQEVMVREAMEAMQRLTVEERRGVIGQIQTKDNHSNASIFQLVDDDPDHGARPITATVRYLQTGILVEALSDNGRSLGSVALDFESNKLKGHCYLSNSDEPESIVLCGDVEQERKVVEE